MASSVTNSNKLVDWMIERAALEVAVQKEFFKVTKEIRKKTEISSDRSLQLVQRLEVINTNINEELARIRNTPASFWANRKVVGALKGCYGLLFISNITSGGLELGYGQGSCGLHTTARTGLIIANYIATALVALAWTASSRATEEHSKLQQDEQTKSLHEAFVVFINSVDTYKNSKTDKSLEECVECHRQVVEKLPKVAKSPDHSKGPTYYNNGLVSALISELPPDSNLKRVASELFTIVHEDQQENTESESKEQKSSPKNSEDSKVSPEDLSELQPTLSQGTPPSFSVSSNSSERADKFVQNWKVLEETLKIDVLEFKGIKIFKNGKIEFLDGEGKKQEFQLFSKTKQASPPQLPLPRVEADLVNVDYRLPSAAINDIQSNPQPNSTSTSSSVVSLSSVVVEPVPATGPTPAEDPSVADSKRVKEEVIVTVHS